jgi:hypothetical protein
MPATGGLLMARRWGAPGRATRIRSSLQLACTTLSLGRAALAAPESSPPADAQPAETPTPAAATPAGSTSGAPALPLDSASSDMLLAELSSPSPLTTDYAQPAVDGPSLNLYGFLDFTYAQQLGSESAIVTWFPSFAIGNFNLYLSSELGSNWRSLAEVRFMYLPHGQVAGGGLFDPDATRNDTSVTDYADVGRTLRWGGVEIERAWIEYTVNSFLTVRAGQWLTPYGIWNVDHGSPTVIGVYRPYIVGEGLFPERQTGIELHGQFYAGDMPIGYHLTLSNGRGPTDAYLDLDNNKGVGARLFAETDALPGVLTLGVSGYRGNYTDRPDNPVVFDLAEGPVVGDLVTLKYRELAFAADLKWQWEDLLLQSEWILADAAYRDEVRPPAVEIPGIPPAFTPDVRRVGYYVLAGYRTPWWNLMPFVIWQSYDNPLQVDVKEVQLGVNLRPVPQVVLKAEYIFVTFTSVDARDIHYLTTQVAWAF